jgi:hypothetical protein
VGDTNADGFVNSADIGQTKSQSGNTVSSSNFREDLNADGFINSADIGRRILAEQFVASPSSIFLLPDGPPVLASPTNANAKYAFSGGISARDWEGLAAIVRATSGEVDWSVACPAPSGRRFIGIPRVRVLTDIPVDDFDALIAGASIVVAVLLGTGSLA